MHLDYIRAFCRVVKVKSITKAAGELHLSQPALSLQVNCLESRFGTRLLERTNRGVKLTPSGELVYRHGQRLIKILDSLDQDLQDIRNPAGRKLKICSSPIPGSYILPVRMLDYVKDHPESKITVTIKPVSEVIESLIDRTTNIGVIAGPLPQGMPAILDEEKISCHSLGHDSIVAVCHRESPWQGTDYSLKQLTSLPLILPHKSCGSRAAIEQWLQNLKISSLSKMNIALELDNCVAITSAVKAKAGIGLVPLLACADNPDLRIINIPHMNISLPFTMLVNPTLGKTLAVKELISFIDFSQCEKQTV